MHNTDPKRASALGQPVFTWLRENLFRNPIDGAITLIASAPVLWVVFQLFEWAVLNGVWSATSFDECQEIIAKLHGAGATGACWAVFNGRFGEVLFGSYPPELYWRPIATFGLLLVAIIPIIFTRLSRHLLWLAAAFPFIAYVLIWGGFGLQVVPSRDIGGVLLIVIIAVTGTPLAIFLGILLAIGRTYAIAPVRMSFAMIIAFWRGVPPIVLMLAGSVIWAYFLPPGANIDLILRASIVLALSTSAIIATNLYGTFSGFPGGEREAADALGLSRVQSFWLIILPQTLRAEKPAIVHTVASLFRNTSLVAMLGLLNPIAMMNVIRAESDWNGVIWELIIAVALLFGGISFAISRYAQHCESKIWAQGHPVRSTRIEE